MQMLQSLRTADACFNTQDNSDGLTSCTPGCGSFGIAGRTSSKSVALAAATTSVTLNALYFRPRA